MLNNACLRTGCHMLCCCVVGTPFVGCEWVAMWTWWYCNHLHIHHTHGHMMKRFLRFHGIGFQFIIADITPQINAIYLVKLNDLPLMGKHIPIETIACGVKLAVVSAGSLAGGAMSVRLTGREAPPINFNSIQILKFYDFHFSCFSFSISPKPKRPSTSADGPRSLPRRGVKSRLLQFASANGYDPSNT